MRMTLHDSADMEPPTMAELIQELDAEARLLRPRLFAVYGYGRHAASPFLGWGMDFTDEGQAVFCSPDSSEIWQSSSAEQVLATRRRLGDAHLTWLTDA
jgi:hypothetical protein